MLKAAIFLSIIVHYVDAILLQIQSHHNRQFCRLGEPCECVGQTEILHSNENFCLEYFIHVSASVNSLDLFVQCHF